MKTYKRLGSALKQLHEWQREGKRVVIARFNKMWVVKGEKTSE